VKVLTDKGFEPGYQTFPMDHSVCMEEITAISDWLQKILG